MGRLQGRDGLAVEVEILRPASISWIELTLTASYASSTLSLLELQATRDRLSPAMASALAPKINTRLLENTAGRSTCALAIRRSASRTVEGTIDETGRTPIKVALRERPVFVGT